MACPEKVVAPVRALSGAPCPFPFPLLAQALLNIPAEEESTSGQKLEAGVSWAQAANSFSFKLYCQLEVKTCCKGADCPVCNRRSEPVIADTLACCYGLQPVDTATCIASCSLKCYDCRGRFSGCSLVGKISLTQSLFVVRCLWTILRVMRDVMWHVAVQVPIMPWLVPSWLACDWHGGHVKTLHSWAH